MIEELFIEGGDDGLGRRFVFDIELAEPLALDRIEAGDYGMCVGCEEAIPAKRLQALPWAKYCVNCQQNLGGMDTHSPHVSLQDNW